MTICILGFFFHPLFLSFVFYHLSAAREDKMFSENEIRNILFQVLSGLAFVHKHGKICLSLVLSIFFKAWLDRALSG